MNITGIEWTTFSANPLKYCDAEGNVVWGCVHASTGCLRCYSEQLAKRYGKGGPFNVATMEGLTPFLDDKELHHMLTAKTIQGKPVSGGKCFCGDMTDLFGEWVPFELLDRLFAVFALRSDVTQQILTKRADRMLKYITSAPKSMERGERLAEWVYRMCDEDAAEWAIPEIEHMWDKPLKNVRLGVSCENQKYADERIPKLCELGEQGWNTMISIEPLLSEVIVPDRYLALGSRAWCVIGGESGHGARPFNVQWARDVIQQCKAAKVSCFLKQVGANPVEPWCKGEHSEALLVEGEDESKVMVSLKLNDRKGGDPKEWPSDLRVREFPQ